MTEPAFDLDEYVSRAREELITVAPGSGREWEGMVERGYREAYRRRDVDGLASMVDLAISILDARGQFEDCLSEIDHAKVVAAGDDEAIVLLDAMRASLLFANGQIGESVATADRIDRLCGASPGSPTRWRAKTHALTVRLQALEDAPYAQLEAPFAAGKSISQRDVLFLMSWYIPYLFAHGQRRRARPWIRAMKLQAQTLGHLWRQADAAAFGLADDIATHASNSPLPNLPAPTPIVSWRVGLLHLRSSLLQDGWNTVEECQARLAEAGRALGNADVGDRESFRQFANAYRGEPIEGCSPPARATVNNLAAALAAAEAVAYAGTQAQALEWHDWLSKEVPEKVRTAVEWPVARARVEGLLAIRAGRSQAAQRCFQAAIEWTASESYIIENLLARLQLSELGATSGGARQARTPSGDRRAQWAAVRDLGLDPTTHAYAVSQGMMQTISGDLVPRLTPREIQVLALLATGSSYRQTADDLGIKWPTVQTLAHRAYEKLGVTGRTRAVTIARELGIL